MRRSLLFKNRNLMNEKDINRQNDHSLPDSYSALKQGNELGGTPLPERTVGAIISVSINFSKSISYEEFRAWRECTSKEGVYQFLKFQFSEYLHNWGKRYSISPKEEIRILLLGLELLVEGTFWARDPRSEHRHSHREFTGQELYKVGISSISVECNHFEALRAEEEKMKQLKWEEEAAEFASIDEDKECDPDLSPAEKMRILKNALWARKAHGYEPSRQEIIVFNVTSLKRAETFFRENRHVSVSSLLVVLDHCAEYFLKHGKITPGDKGFYIKQGCILPFLLRHLSKILDQLKSRTSEDLWHLFEKE